MRQRGNDGALEIFEDCVHWFTVIGCVLGQAIHQIARLHVRQHRILPDVFQVVPDPVHYLVTVTPEFFIVHCVYLPAIPIVARALLRNVN